MWNKEYSTLRLRNARRNDLSRLVELYSKPALYRSKKQATWFIKSYLDYHHIKIATVEGKAIVGVILWFVREEKRHGLSEVIDLWVHEKYRRRGIGERLLREAVQDMEEHFRLDGQGLRKVMLFARQGNEAANRLYQKVGFEASAVVKGLYSEGEDEVLYVLALKDARSASPPESV